MITVSLSPEGRDHVCPSRPILCPRCWNKWMNCHLCIKSSKIYLPLLTSFLESRSLFDSTTTFFAFLWSPPTQHVSSGMHRLPLMYSLSIVISQITPYLATSNNKCSVSCHHTQFLRVKKPGAASFSASGSELQSSREQGRSALEASLRLAELHPSPFTWLWQQAGISWTLYRWH